MSVLSEWDIFVVCLYFLVVIGIGIYSMVVTNRGTLTGYFLAGRRMSWFPVGTSLLASNIGSEHFIGLAGAGAASGIAIAAIELNSGIIVQILGWVYLPVYIASKVSTLPEYMNKRFGGQRIRILLSCISLMLYVFTKVSVNLYAGSLFIRLILNWNIYLSIIVLLALTGVSTMTGGLAGVIYTDMLQCSIMILGSFILMTKGFAEVGGFSELMVRYTKAVPNMTIPNTTCGQPLPDAWELLRSPSSTDMPWPGFVFGQSAASLWYWCSDQMMVQRTLASKSLSHAQGGTLLVGYLKFLPLFLIVIPGMISRVLYTDIVACAVPEECEKYCGSRVSCSNLAFPLLVIKLMPPGLKGILIAVILAALLSDLTAVFNSASTLVTMDIWRVIRKSARTLELLIIGKATVIVMVAVSIAWIPIILSMQGGQLYSYIQSISNYLAPPIAAVYLMAILWKRLNEQGAFWGLMGGFVVGIIRMVLDFYYSSPECGQIDSRFPIIADVHYMYYAIISFWMTVFVAIIISFLTKPPADYKLIRTLYWTRFDSTLRPDEKCLETLGSSNEEYALRTVGDNDTARSTQSLTSHLVELPAWKKLLFWVCGYNPQTEINGEMEEHFCILSPLKQSYRAKIFLGINLLIIVVLTLVVFVLFTFGTRYLLHTLLSNSD